MDNTFGASSEEIKKISGLYKEWFLDYASYVILERAVPHINDGLKPVQRRIMHSMKELEDGRYNKVANIVGNTMKYHPHGDASIADAMVQIGQKDLLIDTQGNWGNVLTGDRAAASRYIEARLTKFALEVVFNPKTTEWQKSYDGRNNEPITLPLKFPILLAHGVEGIAVGLSTKILPHNFLELIDASVKYLQGKKFTLYPDFLTGGLVDVSNYNDGLRGGKVKVRAKIEKIDAKTLRILEVPYNTTTTSLIESILRANDKGKLKIKHIEDNTANQVEINIHLPNGVSPDKTIDALYAFTDCEISISPLSCVIKDDKPVFLGVTEILKTNTDATVNLLKKELEIKLNELENQWHYSSLERIFIENRIYRDIEEEETWEGVIKAINSGLKPYIKHLKRPVTEEDIVRLTEIKIKRISKFDLDKAQQHIESLEAQIEEIKERLNNLIEFAIEYYQNLKKKYGKEKERKTEIRIFDDINAAKVAIANTKFYVDFEDGFIGTSLKKNTLLFECSDLDHIIVFRENGEMLVTKVDTKIFVGKGILHVGIFKKKDKRTTYNVIYRDGTKGTNFVKRFNVTSITREKVYPITQGTKGSNVLYFSANPNGEAEELTVHLKNTGTVKKVKFNFDFKTIAIKGRGTKGNIISKNPIRKIEVFKEGVSTLAPRKIWFDETIKRLNTEERGLFLGEFKGNDKLLLISTEGTAKVLNCDLALHFEKTFLFLEKWQPQKPITCVYFDAEKSRYYIKRFVLENTDRVQDFYQNTHAKSFIETVSTDEQPIFEIEFKKERGKDRRINEKIIVDEFIGVKGIKALGNQLTAYPVKDIHILDAIPKQKELLEDNNLDNPDLEQPELF